MTFRARWLELQPLRCLAFYWLWRLWVVRPAWHGPNRHIHPISDWFDKWRRKENKFKKKVGGLGARRRRRRIYAARSNTPFHDWLFVVFVVCFFLLALRQIFLIIVVVIHRLVRVYVSNMKLAISGASALDVCVCQPLAPIPNGPNRVGGLDGNGSGKGGKGEQQRLKQEKRTG